LKQAGHSGVPTRCHRARMEQVSFNVIDYVRRREAQERAAAKQAETLAARRAHQELAQLYAQLALR